MLDVLAESLRSPSHPIAAALVATARSNGSAGRARSIVGYIPYVGYVLYVVGYDSAASLEKLFLGRRTGGCVREPSYLISGFYAKQNFTFIGIGPAAPSRPLRRLRFLRPLRLKGRLCRRDGAGLRPGFADRRATAQAERSPKKLRFGGPVRPRASSAAASAKSRERKTGGGEPGHGRKSRGIGRAGGVLGSSCPHPRPAFVTRNAAFGLAD